MQFLIWTNQRTGGTNFARALLERSPVVRERVQRAAAGSAWNWRGRSLDNAWQLHEPFNGSDPERIFGALTDEFLASGSIDALETELEEILATRLPFKHCVEMVPAQFNHVLARVSARHGYRHVFLHRRSAVDRLLSLYFAERSGAWGRHFYSPERVDDAIFEHELPVARLADHQRFCVAQLEESWEALRQLGAWQEAVLFEELYAATSPASAVALVTRLLHDLHLSEGDAQDQRFARELVKHGEQGSRAAYGRFAGVDALREAVREQPDARFAQGSFRVHVDAPWESSGALAFAALDRFPESVRGRERFAVAGVAVCREEHPGSILELVEDGYRRRLHWGISSPSIGQRFPDCPGAGFSRFRDERLECHPDASTLFELVRGEERIPLFELRFERIDDNAETRPVPNP